MNILESALTDLAKLLSDNAVPYMVIGGMANAVWGEPRATIDVDITIWVPEENIKDFTAVLTRKYDCLVQDSFGFIQKTRVLPLKTKQGVRIDLIFGALPFEKEAIERAVKKTVNRNPVFFCTSEDLILQKIISNRTKDSEDVKAIIFRRLKELDIDYLEPRIQELSDILERPEIWESWQKWRKEAEKSYSH